MMTLLTRLIIFNLVTVWKVLICQSIAMSVLPGKNSFNLAIKRMLLNFKAPWSDILIGDKNGMSPQPYEKTGFLHMRKQSRYIDSTIHLLPKCEILRLYSHVLWLYSLACVGPGLKPRRLVFSQRGSDEPHREKTCLLGPRPGKTQT